MTDDTTQLELDGDEYGVLLDVLQYARSEAVTSQEAARIESLKVKLMRAFEERQDDTHGDDADREAE